jgi:hypothetical protein
MADDILGHEHLDHGKHLHKHGHGHGHEKHAHTVVWHPPTHVGLRHKKGHDEHHTPISFKIGAMPNWQKWGLSIVIAVPLIFIFYHSFPGLAIALGVIVANTLIEYHKLFTSGTNMDFEVLSVGTAFVSAKYGIGWSLLIVAFGPLVSDLSRSYFTEKSLFKSASLVVTAVAALLLGISSWQLFTAVIFGLIAYYCINMVASDVGAVPNAISRVSTAIFSAYVLFLLLPTIM